MERQMALGNVLPVCFVDLSNTFDIINRNIVFYKLLNMGWKCRVNKDSWSDYTHAVRIIIWLLMEPKQRSLVLGNLSGLMFISTANSLSKWKLINILEISYDPFKHAIKMCTLPTTIICAASLVSFIVCSYRDIWSCNTQLLNICWCPQVYVYFFQHIDNRCVFLWMID